MAKKQTRRSLSVKGLSYQRLKAWCDANGRSASGVAEELFEQFLDAQGQPKETILRPVQLRAPKPPEHSAIRFF